MKDVGVHDASGRRRDIPGVLGPRRVLYPDVDCSPGPHQQDQPGSDRKRWRPPMAPGPRPNRDAAYWWTHARQVLTHGLPVSDVFHDLGGALERPQHCLSDAAPGRRIPLHLDRDTSGGGQGRDEHLHWLQLQVWRLSCAYLKQRGLPPVTAREVDAPHALREPPHARASIWPLSGAHFEPPFLEADFFVAPLFGAGIETAMRPCSTS